MGQRSQIYVRETVNGVTNLVARYYQWNYGSRMVSRCKYTLEWLKEYSEERIPILPEKEKKLVRILDTNFDMVDTMISADIIDEYYELYPEEPFNEAIFFFQDNNNGKLLIDLKDGVLKYAFLDRDAHSNYIMNAEQYMNWDEGINWRENEHLKENGEVDLCKANFPIIEQLGTLMTREEVEEFLSFDYEKHIPKPKKTLERESQYHAFRELILEINNSKEFECMDIDNPGFIEHICKKTNMVEWQYRDIMGDLLKKEPNEA